MESFLFDMIYIFWLLGTNLLIQYNITLVLGIYSGIFAMYLGYYSSQKDTKSILFYAVCVLYALTMTKLVLNFMTFGPLVSKNTVLPNFVLIGGHRLYKTQLAPWYLVSATSSPNISWYAVRTTTSCVYHLFHWSKLQKDISLLDCMGQQSPCHNHSCSLSIHIPNSAVNPLSSLTYWI